MLHANLINGEPKVLGLRHDFGIYKEIIGFDMDAFEHFALEELERAIDISEAKTEQETNKFVVAPGKKEP